MRTPLGSLALLSLTLTPLSAAAQQTSRPAVDIKRAEVETVLHGMIGESIDRQLKVVDIGAGNVAVGILHRTDTHDSDGAHTGLVHTDVSETYVILSGWGTLLTGGEIVSRGETSAGSIVIGPTFSAESRNGTVRPVSEGDVVVIPAGTLHGWTEIPDHVTYFSIRSDPNSVLPAGYVNPEIE
jgi:mannose-6-phosphate isomerase-like protein (cupin superfamily)